MDKNAIEKIIEVLDKKEKAVAMLAPSFVAEFSYPEIIGMLKKLGFDKTVELTFGAKMINRDYHKILEKSKKLIISSACPGVVETIKSKYPKYIKNIIPVDSPMIATAKICRKIYPKHKIVFISPCNFKKIEAEKSKDVDFTIDYQQLQKMFSDRKIKFDKKRVFFDKFYNDYTKIYPLSGGLSKTAHVKGILKPEEIKIIDGWNNVEKFLKNPDKKIKFLDVTFCNGGCIGGPYLSKANSIGERKKRVMKYIEFAKAEAIPKSRKGEIKEAKGISFYKKGL
ncbi:MAG: [Fe-Fe] hydrogenase large subunit C-terminal domain-containing protein [Candidatus Pacearchaeota archaeon]|jgi:iron only hydrogenase large subunit-like protein